jgi:hypothetical protein
VAADGVSKGGVLNPRVDVGGGLSCGCVGGGGVAGLSLGAEEVTRSGRGYSVWKRLRV